MAIHGRLAFTVLIAAVSRVVGVASVLGAAVAKGLSLQQRLPVAISGEEWAKDRHPSFARSHARFEKEMKKQKAHDLGIRQEILSEQREIQDAVDEEAKEGTSVINATKEEQIAMDNFFSDTFSDATARKEGFLGAAPGPASAAKDGAGSEPGLAESMARALEDLGEGGDADHGDGVRTVASTHEQEPTPREGVLRVTRVVPVPVMRVLVMHPDRSTQGMPAIDMSSTTGIGSVSASCQGEMVDRMGHAYRDPARAAEVQECEQAPGHTNDAVELLRESDSKGAKAAIAQTLSDCVKLSATCVDQVASDMVLKMQLSGVAISDECVAVAGTLDTDQRPRQATSACQANTTRSMVDKLAHHNVYGAFSSAQRCLHDCSGIEHPCDFQLAPLLVGQMASAAHQHGLRGMGELMVNGIKAAQEAVHEMVPPPSAAPARSIRASSANGRARKRVSLLAVAARLRISARRLALKFAL